MERLRATHEGTLKFGGVQIPCVVLDDTSRLLTGYSFLAALGLVESEDRFQDLATGLPYFLADNNLQPFISHSLRNLLVPTPYVGLDGEQKFGYKAEVLPEICYVFMDAAGAGVLRGNQKIIGQRCQKIVTALAMVGQEALKREAEKASKE